MKISTQTEVLLERVGEEKAIRMLCEAGYEALDYSAFAEGDLSYARADAPARAKELRLLAASYGVAFNQMHAPFPTMRYGEDDAKNEARREKILRAIEFAGLLGVPHIIVHPIAAVRCNANAPGKFLTKEEQKELNLDFYRGLVPYADAAGVKIALENLWGYDENRRIVPNVCSLPEEFCDYLDTLNDPAHFTACLDIGHAGLTGSSAPAMLRAMGADRITALHIHDNDGVNDSHMMPFTGVVDWPEVIRALREIGYRGDFTYESDVFLRRVPDFCLPDAIRYMVAVARAMRAEITK